VSARRRRSGARWVSQELACCPLLAPSLPAVICGLVFVGIGTFLRAGDGDRLRQPHTRQPIGAPRAAFICRAIFLGPAMAGSAVLGGIFDRFGWAACVAGIGASLAVAAWLAGRLGTDEIGTGARAA